MGTSSLADRCPSIIDNRRYLRAELASTNFDEGGVEMVEHFARALASEQIADLH
jgi:hypothetical protein